MTDSSTCAQWGSTNVNPQNAYAALYVWEHGGVSPRWGPAPAGVINAINAGCYQAFGEDVSDTATVVQAISRSLLRRPLRSEAGQCERDDRAARLLRTAQRMEIELHPSRSLRK